MVRRFVLATVMLALVSGCIGRHQRPRPQPGPRSPVVQTSAANPEALNQCIGKLDRLVARYALLPDRTFGGGCDALGSVQLRDIGLPTTNLGAMTCGLANAFVTWAQGDLQGPAETYLGSRIARIETFGTYACRNVNGAEAGRLSEHAHANAVDVSGFVLADGRRITVTADWNGGGDGSAFLRAVRAAACRRFVTVLSPDYNAAHHDHLHFDMGGRAFCR